MRLTDNFELPRNPMLFAAGWNLNRDSADPAAVFIREGDEQKINRDLSTWNTLALQGSCDRPFIDFNHRGSLLAISPAEPAAWVEAAYWDDGVRLIVTWNPKVEAVIKERIRKGEIRCLSSIARLGECDGIVKVFQGVNPNVAGLVQASALRRTAPIVPEISGYEESSDEQEICELMAAKNKEADVLLIERDGLRIKIPKPARAENLALLCRRFHPDAVALYAREMTTELSAPKGAFGKIMFAPGGDHEIGPSVGGVATAILTVRVDRSAAATLNKSLTDLNAAIAPQRICFDIDHKGEAASGWPISFDWQESPRPGVYATVEYSTLGRQYVEGKVYRAFSGSFFTDADLPKRKDVKPGKVYEIAAGNRGSAENPARMTGLSAPFAGTLTNNPAFDQIAPIWANKNLVAAQIQNFRNQAKVHRENARILRRNNELLRQLIRK